MGRQHEATQLGTALRGNAAEILQASSSAERLCYQSLLAALEIRFGEKHLEDYYRAQMKNRQQRSGESLQEVVTVIEKLTLLAYPDCPQDVRDNLGLQYFVDAVRDTEIQQALRLSDSENLKKALLFAMKFETAQNASERDRAI